jgi:hypothetical protein
MRKKDLQPIILSRDETKSHEYEDELSKLLIIAQTAIVKFHELN